MKKGDKVVVLPNKKVGIVDRVENGFIFLEGSNRPYLRPQLRYMEFGDEAEDQVMIMFAHLGGRTINGK